MMASLEPKPHGRASDEPKCILFVEDEEDDFIVAWHQLRKMQIANVARCVGTVDEMIAYLAGAGIYADRKEYPWPAMIVLDLHLPKRSGLEGQAWLRSKLKFRNMPIVAISALDMENHLQSAVQLGADAYMTKPFNGRDFCRLIVEHKLPVKFANA